MQTGSRVESVFLLFMQIRKSYTEYFYFISLADPGDYADFLLT